MSPPGNDVMYGIYLVNQNIAQLKYISCIRWSDARATLSNLWDLINKIQVVDRKIPREQKRVEGSHTDDVSRASSMEISLPDPPNLDFEINLKRRLVEITLPLKFWKGFNDFPDFSF